MLEVPLELHPLDDLEPLEEEKELEPPRLPLEEGVLEGVLDLDELPLLHPLEELDLDELLLEKELELDLEPPLEKDELPPRAQASSMVGTK